MESPSNFHVQTRPLSIEIDLVETPSSRKDRRTVLAVKTFGGLSDILQQVHHMQQELAELESAVQVQMWRVKHCVNHPMLARRTSLPRASPHIPEKSTLRWWHCFRRPRVL